MAKLLRWVVRRPITRGLWALGGVIVLFAAGILTLGDALSTLQSSSRAATDLAEHRTLAVRVAAIAAQARDSGNRAALESAITDANARQESITAGVSRVIGGAGSETLLADLELAWADGATAARAYVSGSGSFDDVVLSAEVTAERADQILEAVDDLRAVQERRLRELLGGAIAALLLISALPAAALLRARRGLSAADERIRWLTEHDVVTGLPNHDRFERILGETLRGRRKAIAEPPLALLVVGIDRFGRVDAELGRDAADGLLRDFAIRLSLTVPRTHTLAWRAGDEFLVLLPGSGRAAAREVADTVIRALDAPFQHEGGEVRLSASVGIALCPEDGDDEKRLISGAHAARDMAKAEDGRPVCFYGDTPARTDNARLAMEAELHRALGREQFALHYQPQTDISTGLTVGAEALLRWRSPKFGLVAPEVFIPVLEENGQIVPVGEWVLRTACLHARAWQPVEGAPFRVAVNVSARQLSDGDFAETVRRVLEETGLNPAALEIEVTETAAMSDAVAAMVLMGVCELGVNVSLDDFGTGYSSLERLKQLPSRALKIDRSFVSGLLTSADDRAIVRAVIDFAHSLGRAVVAEGVETAEQLVALEEFGCDFAQGYLLSPPVPAEELAELRLLRLGPPLDLPSDGGKARLLARDGELLDDERQVG